MGKVNVVTPEKLPSSVSGYRSTDQSGQIIGEAIAKFGQQLEQYSAREDAINESKAANALLDFKKAYDEQKWQIRTELGLTDPDKAHENTLIKLLRTQ